MKKENGKELKKMKYHCFYLRKLMEKLGNPNLESYISKARDIVIRVKSFGRIAYLIVEQSLRPKQNKLVRREIERWELEGKGKVDATNACNHSFDINIE